MAPAPANSKIQEYFASMNPLSARISADIRAVEDTLKSSDEETVRLTYNDRCAAIDKYLIDDVVEKNATKCSRSGPSAGVHIPKIRKPIKAGSTNHLLALIQSMQPPKPDKYVFEEAGGVWLDEHSAPFSFCKQSQAKCCPLGKNALQNLVETEPADVIRRHHSSKNAERKKQKPDMKNKVPQQQDATNKRHSQEIQPQRAGPGRGIFGVNVMDFMSNSNGQIKSTKLSAHKGQEKKDDDDDGEMQQEMEDKLPQQRQNLQLIAELQAKLKRSNPVEESNVDGTIEHKKEPEKCAQECQPKEESKEAKQVKKSKKVKKPKAPPPPPPAAVDPDHTGDSSHSAGVEGNKGSTFGKHQKAMADQLRNVIAGVKMLKHPRKGSNSTESTAGTTSEPTASTSAGATTTSEEKQTSKPKPKRPEVPKSRSKVVEKEEIRAPGKPEDGPQFCVDVSSPCRIATPKTGLDFLDNW